MLKALEILKEELQELRSRTQQYSYIREEKKKINEAITELEALEIKSKNMENKCILFMNTWEKLGKYSDTIDEIKELDKIYDSMYIDIFGIKT